MDPRTESIKQEVEETLEDMAAKMNQIEERVVGTARETVEQVKEKLDVRHMVAERPWTMLGVSVATGFVVGSIGRSRGRTRDLDYSDGRSRRSRRRRERAESRAFQYEHSEDPYQHFGESEELEPGVLQSVGEGLRQRFGEDHGRRQSVEFGERGYGRATDYEPEYERPSRQLMRRGISQVKRRAPGLLAALREQFGDELEALKRAAVVAAGNSLFGLMQKGLPQLADEFDRARHEMGQQRGDNGWQREQRRPSRQGQGEGRSGSEARYGSEGRFGSEARYGSEGRFGSETRYGSEGRRYGAEAPEGRYGTEGRAGSPYQGQPRYEHESAQPGSAGEPDEGGIRTRGNEPYGSEGGPGPSGRKSHN
jgi:ElaB/YqjD/DUF883 family membrane-anchored ribosome-binding protein